MLSLQQKKLLILSVIVLASVVVGLVAGMVEYADAGRLPAAVKYGGGAFTGSVLLGLAMGTWLGRS
ncbi:hypothetical protein ACFRAO_43835 [Streptomyces sp. NPDC056656]|uniref:hypothetical protein n=1 Tax=unclassified Streptomyces TaxID=2593676 RepID=UPI0036B834D0